MMITTSRTARIATVAALSALGFAGLSGVAQATAQASIPFRVCSPLGCAEQMIEGTILQRPSSSHLIATLTDSAPGVELVGRFRFSPSPLSTEMSIDNQTGFHHFSQGGLMTSVSISACAGRWNCTTQVIPLG